MTIVTVNSRLARQLRREFDRERVAAGERFWESADILPWRSWVRRLWDEQVYSGRDGRVLLASSQELVVWEQVIRASELAVDLLNPEGTARAAAQAWMLLHNWRLPRTEAAFAEVPDTAAFYRWMAAFQDFLTARGFITEAEVPDLLRKRGFEGPDGIAGFDEMTPVQNDLLAGCEEFGLGFPPINVRRNLGLADASEEILEAALWARGLLERNPAARVGVVFPDLAARRTAVSRIFEEVLGTTRAFHISAPVKMAEVPVVQSALLAIKRCSGLTLAEAGRWFRSPYARHTAQQGVRQDMDLRRRGVSRYVEPGRTGIAESQRPCGWSVTFSEIVAASGWPGTRGLDSFEFQAAEAWRELLGEFARLDAVLGELPFGAAVERLEQLAADTGFGSEETGEPIQILGVLEASGARFDGLWLGGLHDGVWPPAARPHPFLPLRLQRAAGMPHASVELQTAQAKRITGRLLRAADEVVCSWPMREEEMGLRASPLVGGPWQVKPAALPSPQTVELESVEGDAAPGLGEERFVRGGMKVIEDQSACPFRAFAKYRLGARALDEVQPGLTPIESGNVTHTALEKIWGELRSQRRLLEIEPGELAQLVRESVRAALSEKLGEGSRALTRIQELEVRRLARLLGEWLDLERQRPPFETRQIEAGQRYEVGGMELDIRVDRVDRYLQDGSLAILDYKTGISSDPSHWTSDRPKAPQLPLYSTMMTEPVSTIAFAQIAAGKVELKGISERGEPVTKPVKSDPLAKRVAEWRVILDRLAREYVEGVAVVKPGKGACEFCALPGLCRIAGLAEPGADE